MGILIFLIIFILAIKEKVKIFEKMKVTYFIGTISYVLYLIHQNIGYQIIIGLNKHFGESYNILYVFITIIIMIGISYLINTFFEKKIQTKLIKKLTIERGKESSETIFCPRRSRMYWLYIK